MSGTWRERADAGAPLKAADLGNALRDLAAADDAVAARLAALEKRLDAAEKAEKAAERPEPKKATGKAEAS